MEYSRKELENLSKEDLIKIILDLQSTRCNDSELSEELEKLIDDPDTWGY